MRELSEDDRRVVGAIVSAPLAWQSPAELARSLGRGVEETTDLLADLDAEGWLSAWEREDDVVVTLSAVGASRLGVRLVESGPDESPRWASSGDPEPPSPRASGVFRGERAASLASVVDPSDSPPEALERAEAALRKLAIGLEAGRRVDLDRLPVPRLLVGSGLTPWPGPAAGLGGSCPACGSGRLEPAMYCLYCDRWGLDHLLLEDRTARPRDPRAPGEVALEGEQRRRSRKARRQARRSAQARARRRPDRAL